MSRLHRIRGQLSALRRARSLTRWLTGYSALLITILWALLLFFCVDFFFELDVLQRIVVWIPTILSLVWAYRQFVRPTQGVLESDLGMALQVEQQHGIPSDLIAALQFEGSNTATWGSPQLKGAVVEYVADLTGKLRVFAGFSRAQMLRRTGTLALTIVFIATSCVAFPGYAMVFLNRVALGGMHYPTQTKIQLVVVNRQVTLDDSQGFYSQLADAKCARGQPVQVYVHCRGRIPDHGELRLSAENSGRQRLVKLLPVELSRRKQWLMDAQRKLEAATKDDGIDTQGPWMAELRQLLRFDAPEVHDRLLDGKGDRKSRLTDALKAVQNKVSSWSDAAIQTEVFFGEIERIVDQVSYSVTVGDAWTEPGRLDLIPLPAVEIQLTPKPPKYAREDESLNATSERNVSVLIGSDLELAIRATNDKPIAAAWLIARTEKNVQRYDFSATESDRHWVLPAEGTVFAKIRHEVRYEIQVADKDGLHLESPIRGVVRIKPDRPPRGAAAVIHRVVLPSARPVIRYRVTDDYGIGKVRLLAQVERQDNALYAKNDSDVQHKNEEQSFALLTGRDVLKRDRLPYSGKLAIDLAPLKLKKGDRLKLTLEVVDDRGAAAGQSFRADPLFLEVSDRAGVLSAISEADEQSEKQLNDVIDRQIGIGASQ